MWCETQYDRRSRTLNGFADQHDPYTCKSDECLDVPIFVFTPDRVGAEELMKPRRRPGRVAYQESNVANRLERASPRRTCAR